MMSAITYLTLGALLARSRERKRLKAYFFLVAALLTFMVGVSRVYLGVHWPLRGYWLVGLLAQCGRCSAGLLPGGFRVVARSSGRQNTLTLLAEVREAEIVHWPSIPHLPLDWDRLIAAHSARPPQSRAIFNELCRAVFGEVSSGEDI